MGHRDAEHGLRRAVEEDGRRRAGGGPRELPALVLVEGDLVVEIGRRENVHVPVAVHVARVDGCGAVGAGGDRVGGPGRGRGAVALVPGNLVVVIGGETVDVPVLSTSAAKMDLAPSAAVISCASSGAGGG
jgi:hypothetical protein